MERDPLMTVKNMSLEFHADPPAKKQDETMLNEKYKEQHKIMAERLPVCPNCNESITGTACNICGDNDTENYNWDSVDTSKGDD